MQDLQQACSRLAHLGHCATSTTATAGAAKCSTATQHGTNQPWIQWLGQFPTTSPVERAVLAAARLRQLPHQSRGFGRQLLQQFDLDGAKLGVQHHRAPHYARRLG